MKIEEGKFYKTRDGRKAGPTVYGSSETVKAYIDGKQSWFFTNTGRRNASMEHDIDLIEEWPEGPVKTVTVTTTKKELVPGEYGRFGLFGSVTYKGPKVCIAARFSTCSFDEQELRDASKLFLELADYLSGQRDQKS